MTETTERFLREISDRVGRELVTDVHLFPVIRQGGVESAVAVVAALPPNAERHIIYSARYRSTIKGIDRGSWHVDVVAEADAPLLTVEEVVRGVVRRSGEGFQPEHISGDALRAIVPPTAAPEAAPA